METPNLPTGYRFRPPVANEASDINRLAASSDAALGVSPTLSEDLIRDFWSRPRFDLEADAGVVEHARNIVGYAEVWSLNPTRLSAFVIVHPDHTGRGIGSALAAVWRTGRRRKPMEKRACSPPPSRRTRPPRNCSTPVDMTGLVASGTWKSS